MRPGLEPGVNVDIVDIQNGIQAALDFGYATKPEDRMVVEYCLQRHARGEEEGSVKSWLSHFGKGELTGWYHGHGIGYPEVRRSLASRA